MKKIGRLEKPDNFGSAHMFSSPFLERMSRTHISIPITMFLVMAGISFYTGYSQTEISIVTGILISLSGFLFFTFVEYMMHKHFFHMDHDTPTKDKIQYSVHGVHHDYPKDKDRLAMPPLVSAAYAVILYLIFKLTLGEFGYYFLPGFLIGYAGYLSVHFIVHAYPPPKNFLKILWINHAIHHYKNPDAAFGVSTPLWDYILGTMPKKN
jgi:sterol desaturase/sphingolipid hydroxylase (fatty acid hydroxylase superfamily)